MTRKRLGAGAHFTTSASTCHRKIEAPCDRRPQARRLWWSWILSHAPVRSVWPISHGHEKSWAQEVLPNGQFCVTTCWEILERKLFASFLTICQARLFLPKECLSSARSPSSLTSHRSSFSSLTRLLAEISFSFASLLACGDRLEALPYSPVLFDRNSTEKGAQDGNKWSWTLENEKKKMISS